MKDYIEGIEKALGMTLEEENINTLEFSDDLLEQLLQFGSDDKRKRIEFPSPEIIVFSPFPDIYHLEFKTYSPGKLGRHWPKDEELSALLLYCDRVVIHDHLPAYASSSRTGYTIGHRYDGIREWLKAVAMWRELILEDVVCVIPQGLAYTPEIMEVYYEDEFTDMAWELATIIYPDGDESNSRFDDMVFLDSSIDNYIATTSIPRVQGRFFAHYFNDKEGIKRHRILVNALMEYLKRKKMTSAAVGQHNPIKGLEEQFATLRLKVPEACRNYSPGQVRARRKEEMFVQIRNRIRKVFNDFSMNASFIQYPPGEFRLFLEGVQKEIDSILKKDKDFSVEEDAFLKICLTGALFDGEAGKRLSPSLEASLDALNNLPVRAKLPDSFGHFFIDYSALEK